MLWHGQGNCSGQLRLWTKTWVKMVPYLAPPHSFQQPMNVLLNSTSGTGKPGQGMSWFNVSDCYANQQGCFLVKHIQNTAKFQVVWECWGHIRHSTWHPECSQGSALHTTRSCLSTASSGSFLNEQQRNVLGVFEQHLKGAANSNSDVLQMKTWSEWALVSST